MNRITVQGLIMTRIFLNLITGLMCASLWNDVCRAPHLQGLQRRVGACRLLQWEQPSCGVALAAAMIKQRACAVEELEGGGGSGGENFGVKKSGEALPPPSPPRPAKLSRRVTPFLLRIQMQVSTVNSDLCNSVPGGGKGQRCVCNMQWLCDWNALEIKRNHSEPTTKYQEPSRAHQEISGTIQSPPGNIRNHPEPTTKFQEPSRAHQEISASFRIPWGGENFPFGNYPGLNWPLATPPPSFFGCVPLHRPRDPQTKIGEQFPQTQHHNPSRNQTVDTTKALSGPQRVKGERPIGTAKGKPTNTMASCQPPLPLHLRAGSSDMCVLCVLGASARARTRTSHMCRPAVLLRCSCVVRDCTGDSWCIPPMLGPDSLYCLCCLCLRHMVRVCQILIHVLICC